MSELDRQVHEWQDSIEWESPVCNYCGSAEKVPFSQTSDKRFHGRQLKTVKCPDCGLIYADPRPTTQSYVEVYRTLWAEQSRKMKFDRTGVSSWHRKMIKEALVYHPTAKSLFDVGTGAGTVMIEGRKLGLRVAGNDLNKYTCDWLKKRDYTVYNVPTIELKTREHFDIMFCLDYIEHSNTCYDDLKWMYNHTRRGGILSLKTMYLDSQEHLKHGGDWHMYSGFHTHYFYKKVLRRMIQKAGYTILYQELKPEIIHITARKK